MDYEEYKRAYFVDPQPMSKFGFIGFHGVALYYQKYEAAVGYYTRVLGPPAYVEGSHTRGWKIGNVWLTLFPSGSGTPQNAEIHFLVNTPAEADRLREAFVEAGGEGEPPSDELMYEPIRYCHVKDPFGTEILVVSRIDVEG